MTCGATFLERRHLPARRGHQLEDHLDGYRHHAVDIRDVDGVMKVFNQYGADIKVVVHTAAQPSHDWAAREPLTDFWA